MAHLKIFLITVTVCIFISCASPRSAINSYQFEEISRLSQPTRVNKILIVGSGGIGTHFFLDNISEELKQKFKDVNVETGYEFMGYKKDFTNQLNKLILTGGFDAVLQFKPMKDIEWNPVIVDKLGGQNIGGPYSGIDFSMRKKFVRFTQEFTVTLFTKNINTHPLWKASLTTNLDSRQNIFYSRITNDILNHLKEIYN